MALNTNALLSVKNISKKFGRGKEATTALRDVSLSVYKGELLAIVGPSGSGKTTLTHIIGGLATPDTGIVHFSGEALKMRSDKTLSLYRNQKIGFVFQNFGLIPHYTALENVMMPLTVQKIPAGERKLRARQLLKAVGLEARSEHQADALSGGERQRVSIARALANKPDIIIADEPTGSLDTARGKEIMNMLSALTRKQGVTVLMVTHDLTLAQLADRVIYIRDGKVEREARP